MTAYVLHLPSIHSPAGEPPGPHQPRVWDPRLDARGVVIQAAVVAPGQWYWRLVRAQWFDPQEAGGRHHIYVETLNTDGTPLAGRPFRVTWPDGAASARTNGRAGFEAGNFPLSPSRNEFSAAINDDGPSDVVLGIGQGADTPQGYNSGLHTATLLVFRRTLYAGDVDPPPTSPTLPPDDPIWAALIQARLAIDTVMRLYKQTGKQA